MEQVQDTAAREARSTVTKFLGEAQVHKTAGIQASAASMQAFKFDPSLIKYDEKGLTVAGVQIPGVPSLNTIIGPYVTNMIKKVKPPVESPAPITEEALAKVRDSASTAKESASKAKDSVRQLDHRVRAQFEGLHVRMARQNDAVVRTNREITSLQTGTRRVVSDMDAFLDLLTDIERRIN
ncbi:hypothetical protein ACFPK5_20855 [Streptomyces beijiangensis]